MKNKRIGKTTESPALKSVAEIPNFPFETFSELQQSVGERHFNLGVDPLAAAEWADQFGGGFKRAAVTLLSLLLIGAAIASVVAAIVMRNYWLLAAAPIQAITF